MDYTLTNSSLRKIINENQNGCKNDIYMNADLKKVYKGWNEKNLLRTKYILEKISAKIYLIGKTKKYYKKKESQWDIFILITTYLLGAGGIPSLIITDDINIIQIVNGIIQGLIIVLGLFKTIYRWLNYKGKIKEYDWAHHKYSDLYIKINSTLNKNIEKRCSFRKFYKEIQQEDFALQLKSPELPKHILKNYYDKMKNNAIKEEILNGDVNIIESYINNNISIYITDLYKQNKKNSENVVNKTYNYQKKEDNINSINSNIHYNDNSKNKKGTFSEDIIVKKNYELNRFLII